MTAYSAASIVEGLDVDKYHFDKFTMRHNIDLLLEELWRDEQCRTDLVAMATSPGPRFDLQISEVFFKKNFILFLGTLIL